MKIETIVIGERVRKDMGDIESLAESIKRHGLLHPIGVTPSRTLIFGHRRLEAMRSLGWADVPAIVHDLEDFLGAECDENAERHDLRPTEAVALGRLIEEQHKAKIEVNRHDHAVAAGKASAAKRLGNSTSVVKDDAVESVGRSDIAAANAVGMSTSTYFRAKTVVEAAEADPATFGDLPELMDETGKVTVAHEELRRRKGANGNGKRKLRHPVHHKTHYPKPNREVERATYALDGICTVLAAVDIDQLDTTKTQAWSVSLKKFSSSISAFARRLADVKG